MSEMNIPPINPEEPNPGDYVYEMVRTFEYPVPPEL